MIDNAKAAYIKSQLDRNVKNPKKFWRIINNFLDNSPTSLSDITFVDDATGNAVPKGGEANFLNDYFVNISTRLDLNVDMNYVDNLPLYEIDESLCLSELMLTVDEVKKHASKIDVSKSSCIKHVKTGICKDVIEILPEKFRLLFETSLRLSIFPRLWTIGYVNVIPKGGDLNKPGNWRPITQTNLYAKILEKIVQKRLLSHLMENNILSKYQFGFLPGKSTQLAVFDLVKNIYSAINNKKVFGAACLDISKAFDCINHRILISKLRKLCLSEQTLNWFDSYLDRNQELCFNGITSDRISIRSGIGQGTIVGPIIFLIYINDIVSMLPDVRINMYADDCILYYTGNNWLITVCKLA